ncbi:hypothetical protein PRZ48_011491 [Zasmidium cellare]|uniref:Uncharacterized protein n=1 Tax=Zasmidium cellare TaxID=395010 RepID=A0ABR0E6I2_ZASCE|nr:hypothetical protein PRZ48_011491 [Zasmidium cellare]
MEREIADLKHDLREDENSMANLEVQKRTAWQKVFDNGRAYFDSCFEVGFEAEWALGEKHCRWLRQMIDQEVLIAHNEAKIRKLKQELGNVKSSKRIAKKKTAVDSSRLNSVLLRALDETRHQQLDAEMDRVQLRIASQEETLQLRKDYHRYDQDRFCGGVIRPLLEKGLLGLLIAQGLHCKMFPTGIGTRSKAQEKKNQRKMVQKLAEVQRTSLDLRNQKWMAKNSKTGICSCANSWETLKKITMTSAYLTWINSSKQMFMQYKS